MQHKTHNVKTEAKTNSGRTRGWVRLLDGTEYFFTSMVYNSWTKKREYLIGDTWISDADIQTVQFQIN